MIPSALWLLMRLKSWSAARRMLRGAKTVRGGLLLLIMLGSFGMMFAPAIVMSFVRPPHVKDFVIPIARNAVPMFLAMLTVTMIATGAGERAFYFAPSEVDFLFAAPFTRRQLLLYKIVGMTSASLGVAVFVSLGTAHISMGLPQAFLGAFLSLFFINNISLATSILGQSIAERLYTNSRRAIALLFGALAIWGAVVAAPRMDVRDLPGSFDRFSASWPGMLMLTPFRPFANVFVAQRVFPDLLLWAFVSLAMNLILIAVVLALEVDYLEAAAHSSQKIYDRLQRIRQGGAFALSSASSKRIRLRPFAWWWGVGPIAWMQLLRGLRASRGIIFLAAIILGAVAVPTFLIHRKEGTPDFLPTLAVIGAIAYFSFLASMQMPLGFRGDVDHLDFLKSLPIGSTGIAWGELAGVTLLVSALEIALLVLAKVAMPIVGHVWLTAIAMIVPYNFLLHAASNLVFLLYPVRISSHTQDLQSVGGIFVFMFFVSATVFVTAGLVAATYAIAYVITRNWLVCGIAATTVLVAIDVALVQVVAWAFRRFDVSLETPAA